MLYPRACHLPAQCTYLDVLLLAHYRHPLRYLKNIRPAKMDRRSLFHGANPIAKKGVQSPVGQSLTQCPFFLE